MTIHHDLKSYAQGLKASRSVPLATGNIFTGSHVHQYEFNKRGRHLLVGGQQYLGAVSVTPGGQNDAGNWLQGCLTDAGLWIITPAALGGILELYAHEYEQVRFRHLRVVYVPQVPATEPGAIAIYFSPSPAHDEVSPGEGALVRASTMTFVSGQVFEEMYLDIQPADTLKRYFDNAEGMFALMTQGTICTMIAGGITPVYLTTQTFGALYLEYSVEYWSPRLDDIVSVNPEFEVNVTFDATTAMTNQYAVKFSDLAGADPVFYTTGFPYATSELVNYLAYGTLSLRGAKTGGTTDPTYVLQDDNLSRTFTAGTMIYMRFIESPTGGKVYAVLFSSLAAAQDFVAVPGSGWAAVDGQLIWENTIAAAACEHFILSFSVRAFELKDA